MGEVESRMAARKLVKVSVIIPSYNSAQYVRDALDSVFNQTIDDYEVIVVDDGSTDNTKNIIEKEYPKVRYFYTKNQGVAKARNFGIRKSRGSFIAFLDSDDKWLPEKLEKQLDAFRDDACLMLVFTEHKFFNQYGILKNSFSKKEILMTGDIVKNIFLHSHVATPTVMVKKNVFDEVGFFEEGLSAAEDDNMWLRIALKFKIKLIDQPLVMCRVTEGSLSRTPKNLIDGVKAHVSMIEHDFPELRKRLGWLNVRKKKSQIFFTEGYYFFSLSKHPTATICFIKSFLFFPGSKNFTYLLFSLAPVKFVTRLRRFKNVVLKRPEND